MKKVKIMLLATLVVAGVGGALAFKAAKHDQFYCGTQSNSCPDLKTGIKQVQLGFDENLFCSTESTATDCNIRVTTN